MANLYPPGGDPEEAQATARLWPQPGGAAGSGGSRRDRRKALRWTAGVAAAVLLGAGGVLAGSALSAPSNVAANSAASGPSSQAALLNAALSSANSPHGLSSARSGQPLAGEARACVLARRAARAARLAGRPRLSRAFAAVAGRCRPLLRDVVRFFLRNGVDGQFAFRTRSGLRTLAYERGVIESVTPGSALVVKAANGLTWTWSLVSATVVRDRSGKTTESALSGGETVWVGGPVVKGAKDARLIVLNPPSGPMGRAPADTPAPSASAPSKA